MPIQLTLNIDTATLQDLLAYLEETASGQEPAEAAVHALRYWLAEVRKQAPSPDAPALRGYQWKSLFLPDGSRLRMYCQHEYGYARVVGDQLMYHGRALTPNQFVAACSGGTRNAWRDVSVNFPGEKTWKLACVRRDELVRLGQQAAAGAASAATPPLNTSGLQENAWPARERRRNFTALDDVAFD
ncbi:hypothetical protein [Pseudoduganella violacea]|uniref:DUF2924 domain-containing protein n=1 Tax=Pseudoduganella violacea TaxID=1715466 RepID=A0A7W5B8D0_9BURK|nr:hypothetical protein [Pseudoduganella violacea]MBB3117690.1 hypothetical protein [Pseudoduganella violacea]